jgi:hypothetical protein
MKPYLEPALHEIMLTASKCNKNGLYWRILSNKAVAIYDCRVDLTKQLENAKFNSMNDIVQMLVQATAVFKNRKIAEHLFKCKFSDIKPDDLYDLIDDALDSGEYTESCVVTVEDLYVLIDLNLRMVCVTDVEADIAPLLAQEETATESAVEVVEPQAELV